MLTGHRRFLLRQATGPTAGEIASGDVNVLVGAFSDAQMFEDPWTLPPDKWDPTTWEPASLARASSGGRSPVRGEAIPYMIGAVKVGNLAEVGDLPMRPVWSLSDRETWEPRGLGDWRTAEVYGSYPEERHYAGEAIPYMVGAVPGLRSRRGAAEAGPSARKADIAKDQARPTYRARRALLAWASKNRIPVGAQFQAESPDGSLTAYGALLQLPSTNDRIQVANQAKQIALLQRTFYNMVRLQGAGQVLLYFTDDPAGFLVTTRGELAHVGFLGKLGNMFKKKSPKEKLEQLETRYKRWVSGEGKPGPLDSKEGLLARINKMRSELGLPEMKEDGTTEGGGEPESAGRFGGGMAKPFSFGGGGRSGGGGGRKRRRRRKQRRQRRQQQQQGQQPQIIVIREGGGGGDYYGGDDYYDDSDSEDD